MTPLWVVVEHAGGEHWCDESGGVARHVDHPVDGAGKLGCDVVHQADVSGVLGSVETVPEREDGDAQNPVGGGVS